MSVTHLFVSALPDGADATLVRPSNWNEAHVVSIDNADVAAGAGIVESKLSLNFPTHAAVTIGTANGLSLVGQAVSLGLASAGVTGALSGTDWTAFNSKQSALTFPLSPTLGGTGIANGASATLTLPNAATTITGGGTLALGGFTLTVPATGTAALLATANVFTAVQKVNVNSTTALLVEQDGVKDNVLVVDTTNSRIGIGIASPAVKMELDGGIRISGGTNQNSFVQIGGQSIGDINATEPYLYINTVRISATGAEVLKVNSRTGGNATLRVNAIAATVWAAPGNEPAIFTAKDSDEGGTRYANAYFGGTAVLNADEKVRISPSFSNHIGLIVAGVASQSANLQEWRDSSARILASIDASGVGLISPTTTVTNAVLQALQLQAVVSTASTGGAAGFGVGQSFYAETATDGTNQQQGKIETSWIDATNASRKAKMSLSAYDTAARLGLEIEASGTAAKLGFFGVTPVVRPTALTTQLTAITHTAPGTPDYAIQDLIDSSAGAAFGFATKDEGNTVLSVIANIQTRLSEVETKLKALGLLT